VNLDFTHIFQSHVLVGAPPPPPTTMASDEEYDRESSPNAFPEDFRLDGKRLWDKSNLDGVDASLWAPLDTEPAHLARVLLAHAPHSVVYVCTGPLTTLAAALTTHPDIASRLQRLVWMGGAVDVPGNVEELSPNAEWNVYADSASARLVFARLVDVPIWMMPLDATNDVPLSKHFLNRLAVQCPQSFISVAYHATAQKTQYYLWDVATVAWFLRPDIVTRVDTFGCSVDATTGVTYRDDSPESRMVVVALRLNATQLFDWMEQLCIEEI
jgi:inosine-uridine nucleoside N-ribohydrolase